MCLSPSYGYVSSRRRFNSQLFSFPRSSSYHLNLRMRGKNGEAIFRILSLFSIFPSYTRTVWLTRWHSCLVYPRRNRPNTFTPETNIQMKINSNEKDLPTKNNENDGTNMETFPRLLSYVWNTNWLIIVIRKGNSFHSILSSSRLLGSTQPLIFLRSKNLILLAQVAKLVLKGKKSFYYYFLEIFWILGLSSYNTYDRHLFSVWSANQEIPSMEAMMLHCNAFFRILFLAIGKWTLCFRRMCRGGKIGKFSNSFQSFFSFFSHSLGLFGVSMLIKFLESSHAIIKYYLSKLTYGLEGLSTLHIIYKQNNGNSACFRTITGSWCLPFIIEPNGELENTHIHTQAPIL